MNFFFRLRFAFCVVTKMKSVLTPERRPQKSSANTEVMQSSITVYCRSENYRLDNAKCKIFRKSIVKFNSSVFKSLHIALSTRYDITHFHSGRVWTLLMSKFISVRRRSELRCRLFWRITTEDGSLVLIIILKIRLLLSRGGFK